MVMKQASKNDLTSGKQIYFRGYIYNVLWVSESRVKIVLPGHHPNSWVSPYPAGTYTIPASWELPITHPELYVMN
ncbi:hypothetical protein NIES2109_30580 [Nostoc sp. HK-01]|nr:hypothetical protein NIES2109_30580 [Nostoc sp. HK-01]